MKDFLNLSTCLVLAVLGALTLGDVAFTVASHGPSHLTSPSHVSAQRPSFASAQEVMGAKGMVCFGMGFGLLMAINQGLSRRNVSCKASFQQPGTIVVKEQDTDISKILEMNQFFLVKCASILVAVGFLQQGGINTSMLDSSVLSLYKFVVKLSSLA